MYQILLYLVQFFRTDGDIGICEKILKKGIEADKTCTDFYLEYAGLLFNIMKQSKDALKYCDEALKHSPKNQRALEMKGKQGLN